MIVASSLRWTLFVLIPFIIVLAVHFIVPLQFILKSSPISQQIYNTYRIQSEQTAITTLSILGAKVMQDRLQSYESIRSLFTTVLQNQAVYQSIDFNNMKLNYAGDLAKNNSPKKFQSMWYAPGVTSVEQMTSQQQYIYSLYLKVEPFIRTSLGSQNSSNSTIDSLSLEIILNFYGTPLLFRFPSEADPQYLNPDIDIYSDIYKRTTENWQLNNEYKYTIFVKNQIMYICSILIDYLDTVNEFSLGVTCLKINVNYLFTELTSLGVPTYKYSTNIYYMISPIYQTGTLPQILFNFTDSNVSNVNFPQNGYYEVPTNVNKLLLTPQTFQKLVVSQVTTVKTYFQVPIIINDHKNIPNTILYLVAQSSFKPIDFANQKKTATILKSILFPSIALIIVSLIVSIVVVRCLISNFEVSLQVLGDNCRHILADSIDLKIPEYQGTKDIQIIFHNFSIINQLHQASSQNFYACPQPQKLLKYFKVYKLFEKLGYDLSNIMQMIGTCHYNMKEYIDADFYFNKVVEMSVKQMQNNYGPLKKFLQQQKKKWRKDKYSKQSQEKLLRRLLKLIKCRIWQIQTSEIKPEILHSIKLYKGLVNRKTSSGYILIVLMEARYYLTIKKLSLVLPCLKEAQKYINFLQKRQKKENSFIEDELYTPPQILRSYLLLFKGLLRIARKNIPGAYKMFILALQTNIFLPSLYQRIKNEVFSLLVQKNINVDLMKNNYYFSQLKQTANEYLFIMDWTKNEELSKQIDKYQSKEIINSAIRIFQQHVDDQDRISIIRFSLQNQIIANLTKKIKNQQILKRQIKGLIKIRTSKRIAYLIDAFQQSVNRIRKLQCDKIIIIFKRPQTKIEYQKLQNIIRKTKNLKVFVIGFEQRPTYFTHQFLTINIQNEQDIDRMLMIRKQVTRTNSISPF